VNTDVAVTLHLHLDAPVYISSCAPSRAAVFSDDNAVAAYLSSIACSERRSCIVRSMRLCVRRGTICCTQRHDNLCTCEQFTVEFLTDYTDCSLSAAEPSVIVSSHIKWRLLPRSQVLVLARSTLSHVSDYAVVPVFLMPVVLSIAVPTMADPH
jgi:hypothetical protein